MTIAPYASQQDAPDKPAPAEAAKKELFETVAGALKNIGEVREAAEKGLSHVGDMLTKIGKEVSDYKPPENVTRRQRVGAFCKALLGSFVSLLVAGGAVAGIVCAFVFGSVPTGLAVLALTGTAVTGPITKLVIWSLKQFKTAFFSGSKEASMLDRIDSVTQQLRTNVLPSKKRTELIDELEKLVQQNASEVKQVLADDIIPKIVEFITFQRECVKTGVYYEQMTPHIIDVVELPLAKKLHLAPFAHPVDQLFSSYLRDTSSDRSGDDLHSFYQEMFDEKRTYKKPELMDATLFMSALDVKIISRVLLEEDPLTDRAIHDLIKFLSSLKPSVSLSLVHYLNRYPLTEGQKEQMRRFVQALQSKHSDPIVQRHEELELLLKKCAEAAVP